ncbi:opsin Rh6-like [Hydractinia symbiolongicarpus]|uniref:opsin Rh6-like n=1 Tax=Hydractinia symbiolongicarpus TaxID=13093 RepID=UPI00254E16F1|nr:opsin Rh6-like [Hydractinia symbiolongicarpus]
MDCEPRMTLLNPPYTIIFGGLFIVFALIGIVSNIVALKIINVPIVKTPTNKLLMSLVISNLLAALILKPIFVLQLFNHSMIMNCYVDILRRYLCILLPGSATLLITVIAYDRCILLTRLNDYERHMTRRKFVTLTAFCFIFPALVPFLGAFGDVAYLGVALFSTIGSFLLMILAFYFIKKAIKKHNIMMIKHHREATLYANMVNNRHKEQQRREMVHVKLSRFVLLLIIVNSFCMSFSNAWILLNLTDKNYNFMDTIVHQRFYLVAMTVLCVNACINPFIYFLKHPEFKTTLRELLHK